MFTFNVYWKVGARKRRNNRKISSQDEWKPPTLNDVKINFDAAFFYFRAQAWIVMRNHDERIVGAWTRCFATPNAYCAELKATVYAFELGESIGLNKCIFEGDALQAILAVKGYSNYEDWHAEEQIRCCRRFLKGHPLWVFYFVNRRCNAFAQNLAHWTKLSSFDGIINLDTLRLGIFCDGEESNVIVDEDEYND